MCAMTFSPRTGPVIMESRILCRKSLIRFKMAAGSKLQRVVLSALCELKRKLVIE